MFPYQDEPAPPPQRPELDREAKEMWDYLQEVIADYERYLSDIGGLGFAAPNVLYYRDEIQEMLEEFKLDTRVDFRTVWVRVKALDEILRQNQQTIVDEIGHANFRQYQIINDPPKSHWWWWLNRVTDAPPPQPAWWQFWKPQMQQQAEEEEEAPAAPPDPDKELPPAEFGRDGRPGL